MFIWLLLDIRVSEVSAKLEVAIRGTLRMSPPAHGAVGVPAAAGCGVLLGLAPTGVCEMLGIPALRVRLGSPPASPRCLLHAGFATANWILECCHSNTKQITS